MKLYFEQTVTAEEYTQMAYSFLGKLNAAEYSSVLHYTDSGHTSVNRSLSGADDMDVNVQSIISDIDSALSKGEQKKRTLYRGASSKEFKPVDGMIVSETYLSASYSPVQAMKFIKTTPNPIVYVIESLAGAEVSDIHDEMEVIIPRGTSFKISEVKENVEYTALYHGTDYGVSTSNVTLIFISQVVDK